MAKHCLSQPPKQHPSFGTFDLLATAYPIAHFFLSHPAACPLHQLTPSPHPLAISNGYASMLNTLFDNPLLTPAHDNVLAVSPPMVTNCLRHRSSLPLSTWSSLQEHIQ
ncbi:hypothetical protein PAHAL_2G283500 [Panicum hallii]|uniref:Uncharacterized protein n=1 Tax=Panicum hallii TaxID=206008 RepID=A0A2S3GZY4_9POAL|nr:hypothetical protein PAHAL_2G283500 [Panicum hallii]